MTDYPDVQVRGAYHRGGEAKMISDALMPGAIVQLEREPANSFDSNAIKVHYLSQHIGYLAAEEAAYIAPKMDEGKEFVAKVTGRHGGRNISYPLVLVSERRDLDPNWGDSYPYHGQD